MGLFRFRESLKKFRIDFLRRVGSVVSSAVGEEVLYQQLLLPGRDTAYSASSNRLPQILFVEAHFQFRNLSSGSTLL